VGRNDMPCHIARSDVRPAGIICGLFLGAGERHNSQHAVCWAAAARKEQNGEGSVCGVRPGIAVYCEQGCRHRRSEITMCSRLPWCRRRWPKTIKRPRLQTLTDKMFLGCDDGSNPTTTDKTARRLWPLAKLSNKWASPGPS